MDIKEQIFVTGITCVLIVLVTLIFILHRKRKENPSDKVGKNGEKKVAKALKSFCRKNKYTLLNDVYLPLYEMTTQIDHLIVGDFGILCVETKALSGELYGDYEEKDWTQIIGNRKVKIHNPLKQNKTHMDCLQHILRKEKVYNCPIDGIVVFTSNKLTLNLQRGMPVVKLGNLKQYLKNPMFNKNSNTKVDSVVSAIKKHRVTSRKTQKQHVKNVQNIAKGNK